MRSILARPAGRSDRVSPVEETPGEYLSRMAGYLGRDDPFAVLRSTPRALRRLVAGAPRRRLAARPAPGKWSAVEILAHVADVDLVWGYRMRRILEKPGLRIEPMEQDRWVAACRYAEARAGDALEAFAAIRRWNLALLARVPPSALRRRGEHPYFGSLTIAGIIRMLAGHDRNHLGQLRGLLR